MERLLRKFETAKTLVPAAGPARRRRSRRGYGVDLFRLDRAGDGRGARRAGGAGHASRRAAPARASRSPTRSSTSSPRTSRCSWSSRTATRSCARCWSTRAASIPAQARSRCCTTTARRSPRASSPARSRETLRALDVTPLQEGRAMTYIAKPKLHHPDAADERARLHAPRLRGRDLDAVRRLRPRLDLAPRSSRPASSSTSRRIASPSCRASAARRRRRPISSASSHGFNTRARPHALGADRRQPRQPRPDLPRRLRRRRLAPRSASASSRTRMRRGVNMVYIVENNGVYGLTKGQFSATADKGSQEQEAAWSTTTRRSTWSAWRCSSARPSSRAASPATRSSSCR